MLGNRTSSTIRAPITANLIMLTHVTLDHTLLVPVCSGEHVPPKHQAVESPNVSADVAIGLMEHLISGQAKLCKPLTTNISLPIKYYGSSRGGIDLMQLTSSLKLEM